MLKAKQSQIYIKIKWFVFACYCYIIRILLILFDDDYNMTVRGFKRKWTINWCTSSVRINKITPFEDQNCSLKRLTLLVMNSQIKTTQSFWFNFFNLLSFVIWCLLSSCGGPLKAIMTTLQGKFSPLIFIIKSCNLNSCSILLPTN